MIKITIANSSIHCQERPDLDLLVLTKSMSTSEDLGCQSANQESSLPAENRLTWLLNQLAALAWPVLLGYAEAEPLVRNSHICLCVPT